MDAGQSPLRIPPRARPPVGADERTLLAAALDLQRAVVHWKCEGLRDEDARRPLVATSPLTTLAGLVSHLRWVEHCWFEVLLLGRPEDGNPQFGPDPEGADMRVHGVPLGRLREEYARQCETSDEIVARHPLDARSVHPAAQGVDLRWILVHMIQETARHAGHADLLREHLDGTRGYL